MLKKVFLILVFLGLTAFGFRYEYADNSNGLDTNMILNFKADSLKYSITFDLSPYLDFSIFVQAMDTANSQITFGSAAIKFHYWIETGNISVNGNGNKDTMWNIMSPIIVDTFDITTAGNMVIKPRTIDSLGIFNRSFKAIDTLSVIGYGVQCRDIRFMHTADKFFRIAFKGLTGNRTAAGGFIRLLCGQYRSIFVPTRTR